MGHIEKYIGRKWEKGIDNVQKVCYNKDVLRLAKFKELLSNAKTDGFLPHFTVPRVLLKTPEIRFFHILFIVQEFISAKRAWVYAFFLRPTHRGVAKR